MAKGKSKNRAKAKADKGAKAKRLEAGSQDRLPRGVRKHLRELERQLSDAARQERKRLRKLERAVFRRQLIQATLEELRGETTVVVVPVVKAEAPKATPAPTAPVAKAKAPTTASRTTVKSAAKPAAGAQAEAKTTD